MAVISIYQYFTCQVDDREVKGGSLSSAKSITIADDEVHDATHKIAPETAVKLFDASEMETLGNFDFLYLESDLDVLIQYTTGVGVSDLYLVTELKGSGTAGEMGVGRVLNSDLAHLADGSVDSFDGTESVIGEVWAYNESTENTARVRIVAAT